MDQKFIQACADLLRFLPEDLKREGLQKTPERMARAFTELTEGYSQNLEEICNGAIFQERCSEMIVVRDIQFFSLCEHHLLPFFGRAHVAYVPNGRILGLSKIPRIVEMFSRRLQVQERLTEQVAESVNEVIGPLGVGCVIEAFHLCTMMRGVRLPSTNMVTSALRGAFLGDSRTRAEFFQLVRSEERRVP